MASTVSPMRARVSSISSRVSSISSRMSLGSWPIARPPWCSRLLARARAVWRPAPSVGPEGRADLQLPPRPRRRSRRPARWACRCRAPRSRRSSGPRAPSVRRRPRRRTSRRPGRPACPSATSQPWPGRSPGGPGSPSPATAASAARRSDGRCRPVRCFPRHSSLVHVGAARGLGGRHGAGCRRSGRIGGGGTGVGARPAAVGGAPPRLVPPPARRLQEARGRQPERQPAEGHSPGLLAAELLDVVEDAVGVRLLQVAAEPLSALGDLIDHLGRLVLALLAKLLGDRAHVARVRCHLVAELRRALVDLLAQPAARLVRSALGLLLGHLLGLLCLLRRLIGSTWGAAVWPLCHVSYLPGVGGY